MWPRNWADGAPALKCELEGLDASNARKWDSRASGRFVPEKVSVLQKFFTVKLKLIKICTLLKTFSRITATVSSLTKQNVIAIIFRISNWIIWESLSRIFWIDYWILISNVQWWLWSWSSPVYSSVKVEYPSISQGIQDQNWLGDTQSQSCFRYSSF